MKFAAYSLALLTLLQSCSQNNVKQDKNLKKYFDENKVEGCFALMDNGTGKFTVHNLGRYRDSSYLPASTFKIVNSLIGLQTGKISSDSMVIKWDGVKRRVEEWNRDLTMYDAFRVSAVNYYQEVARRIGKDTMQLWLDSLRYGTKKITSTIDSFWLDNSLKISPDEELGLVKRLYFDQLPFFKSYQETVKRTMLFENNANYRLGYKTGWGFTEKGHALGWVVGWIEENNHPYFFVLNIESPDKDFDMWTVRMKMLKDILKYLGFFNGKM
ncbi:MAG: class D beta-lactamase [Chitinophagaceae bacterium]|nr:class D beta-lactamase [Chitinophagaceae bacterium]MBK9465425.1 class D beta-lactamase [Chitinophagaceae bacterium]MBK9660828.1 class D beta-lactamase [Chitinophagaceae bacterium]MBL0068944.1 class D beta-lactamase [Chitinophagaceae bacterium]HQW42634.1 penicillin-binding transpeptidase domain-containing protein [Chitinophagaceae bacterium]